MAFRNDNREEWERDGRSLLAPLTERDPKPRRALVESAIDRAYASMSVRDIVEFSTAVFVKEHLWSSIQALTSLLRGDNGRTQNHD